MELRRVVHAAATVDIGRRQQAFDQRRGAQPEIGVEIHVAHGSDIVHRHEQERHASRQIDGT